MSFRVENHPFLPTRVPYITQAGIFDTKPVTCDLTAFLKNHGPTTQIVNPYIMLGQSMEKARVWFTRRVDDIRIKQAKKNLRLVQSQTKSLKELQDVEKWIRKFFSLVDKLDMADFLVKKVLELLSRKPKSLFSRVMSLEQGGMHPELPTLSFDYREKFLEELSTNGFAIDTLHKNRIANGIFDTLIPRVAVLGGHSMGGITALQAMQKNLSDIAMVLGWGSPINGANPKAVPIKQIVYRIFPMLRELDQNSSVLRETRETKLPNDTTYIGIELKNGEDKVILDCTFNHACSGMHQIQVEPRKAKFSEMFSAYLLPFVFLIGKAISNLGKRIERTKYHLAYTSENHIPFYWSEEKGSLLGEFTCSEEDINHGRKLLYRTNYWQLQERYLSFLKQKIENSNCAGDFSSFKEELNELMKYPLPFNNSEYHLACQMENLL